MIPVPGRALAHEIDSSAVNDRERHAESPDQPRIRRPVASGKIGGIGEFVPNSADMSLGLMRAYPVNADTHYM